MGNSSQNVGVYFYYHWVGFLYDASPWDNTFNCFGLCLVNRGEKNLIFFEKDFKQKNIQVFENKTCY
ncbi:MAG: hypothetical protein Athens071416_578 [Parcubacteria group bacterium Athens0714_16]|nr:MAG: hypothetical protein Athens071416_578 [Parcubacteria group bacterium Athens0714_16]